MDEKIFVKNIGDTVHTENRIDLGFINIGPGKAVEVPTKEIGEGIIRDSKRGDLKLLVVEEKKKVQVLSAKGKGPLGTPQANK